MIPDKDKTKEQLVDEMAVLCQRIAELEILETKRKWAEQRLEHLNAVLRTIRKVNQLIAREKDPDRLLESICDSFIITRGYYNIWIALLDESQRLLVTAEAGLGKAFLPMVKRLKRGELTICGQRALLQSDVVVTEDPFSSCTDCPLANKYSGRGALTIRLEHGGKVYGLLSASIPAALIADEEEQALFQEIAKDITLALHDIEFEEEYKQAEEEIQIQRARFESIFERSLEGIVTLDINNNILEANTGFENIFGYKRKEIIGKRLDDLIVPERFYSTEAKELDKMALDGILSNETIRKRKDGTEINVSMSAGPIETGEEIGGLFVIFRDITERKQAEEREKQLQQELYLSSRLASIGELSAGVAHEINNPLTGILGFSQRLLRKSTDEKVKQDLERIHNEALRAAKVVENLLAFARQTKPMREHLDINDIVQKTLELRAYELKTGNIKVALDLAPSLPKIIVDSHQMQEVFLNIILNTEQTMTEASRGGKLTIKTQETKGYIRISFGDDGPGIAAEHLDKLFDPFFTTRGENGGTGLGLSVCHGIVVEHGGKMIARSKPGRGATFFVELPTATEEIDESKIIYRQPVRGSK
jgi:two-component system NtrC family sensor kinase